MLSANNQDLSVEIFLVNNQLINLDKSIVTALSSVVNGGSLLRLSPRPSYELE
jgi:hypothetical protein